MKWGKTKPADDQDPEGDATPQNKKLQAFLGIFNYLGKFSPSTESICEPLAKLWSCKAVLTWNTSYQALYDKTKSLIKNNICMKFYNETKCLYLETYASSIGLGAALLQTRDGATCPTNAASDNTILRPILFASKLLTSAEWRYSTTEGEALGILHGLKKFDYC